MKKKRKASRYLKPSANNELKPISRTKKTTSNALRILDRISGDDPQLRRLIEKEHRKLDVAHKIIDLRKASGISQGELAAKIGTTQSVISRLEDADYNGDSRTILRRIAEAGNFK